jgi:hypothetical protein
MKINLDDIEKNEPFGAPDGYFESLSDRIMDRIETEEEVEPGLKQRFLQPWMRYAAAACVVLLATVVFITNRNNTAEPTAEELLSQVSNEAILDYLKDMDVTAEEILDVASFDEMDIDQIQEESLPDLDLETLDLLIDELDFNEQDINTL